MPLTKSASLRYRIIDKCLHHMRKYPTLEFIIKKVSQELGTDISSSMITKDIQFMKSHYQAPIAYNRNYKGYYYTEDSYSLEKFPLTHEEIDALDFSTALLGQLKGTKLFQQYENAINKVIEGYRIHKILGRSELQILQTEEPISTGGSQWLEPNLKAIVDKQLLSITYQGFSKKPSIHEFSAYFLKEYRNRWYVVGHSSRTNNVIVLALDRIQSVKNVKGIYLSDPSFNPETYFKYSLGITQIHDAQPQEVLLSFTPDQAQYILSQPLHHSQEVVKSNSRQVVVRLFVYLSQELLMMILSYGSGVKVIKPLTLREQVLNSIKEMGRLYK